MTTFEKTTALRREFEGTSDRAAAIVAGAFLDEVLQEILQEFFVEDKSKDRNLFQGTRPLATFSAKIDIAFRLGLISEGERRTLDKVRDIRNQFAHQLDNLSFTTQSIIDRCRNIEVPVEMIVPRFFPLSQAGAEPPLPKLVKANSSDPRSVFQEAVLTLMHNLAARVVSACVERRGSPSEFKNASEPAEHLLSQTKALLDRSMQLVQDTGRSEEERASLDESIKKVAALVKVQEFIAQQVKRAHQAETKQT